MQPIRIALLTVSDGVTAGTRTDGSGDTIAAWAVQPGRTLAARATVPDDTAAIASALLRFVDDGADLVVTTGGTGLTARDVTPEATRAVIEREAPGIAEAIRGRGLRHTPHAILSRNIAGTRGACLIVNLAGSTGAVRDGLAVLDEVLIHAVELLRGDPTLKHPIDG